MGVFWAPEENCQGIQACKLVLPNSDENLQLVCCFGTSIIFIYNLRKSPGHLEILDASKLQLANAA